MKTIGIIGSRKRNTAEDYLLVEYKFLSIYENGDSIVSGGCPKGGDYFAEILAAKFNCPIKIYYADWDRFGKSAGFIRNNYIAEDADILLACVADDRTGGTEDTIKKFLKTKGEDRLYLI